MKIINPLDVNHTHFSSVVSNDQLRPVMTGVFFDLKNNCMAATNSHVLAIYPLKVELAEYEEKLPPAELDGLHIHQSKIVPLEFFDKRKYMGNVKNYAFPIHYDLSDEKYAKVFNGPEEVFKCRYIEGVFPNYQAIIPKPSDTSMIDEIGLNIGLVLDLYKANPFSDKGLKFRFFNKNKAIRFESFVDPMFHGVIMPRI